MDIFPYRYFVYGITLHSEIPLCLPEHGYGELAAIELRAAPASFFAKSIEGLSLEQASGSWYQIGRLADGSYYLRWEGVGEFLISGNGCRMFCRQFDLASSESFQVYMLGQALSYALVGQGFEPLHATAVVVNGEAIVFLGDSGFGKSTLAASFLQGGHQVLTDDLLIIMQVSNGRVSQAETGRREVRRDQETVSGNGSSLLAYAGPPRIKLVRKAAQRFLGKATDGVRMNRDSAKFILPLERMRSYSSPAPVRAIFALAPPHELFRIEELRLDSLSPSEAFVEFVKNTFNSRITDSARLRRQFTDASRLASLTGMQRLAIPRSFRHLPAVRDGIISKLDIVPLEVACGG